MSAEARKVWIGIGKTLAAYLVGIFLYSFIGYGTHRYQEHVFPNHYPAAELSVFWPITLPVAAGVDLSRAVFGEAPDQQPTHD